MKRTIILAVVMFICFTIKAQNKENGKFFIGIIRTPQNTAHDFISFDVSDYLRFPPPNDGWAHIPLGEKNLTLPNWGVNLGVSVPVSKQFDFLMDLQFSVGNSVNYLIMFGTTFNVVKNKYVTFGPTAKVGFAYTTIGLGDVSVYNANYVATENGDFYDGYHISASVFGFAYQLGFTGTCRLTKRLSLLGQFGLGGAYMGMMNIEVTPTDGSPFKLDLSSKDCVEENSYRHIGFTPRVKSYGLYYNLGVAFSF